MDYPVDCQRHWGVCITDMDGIHVDGRPCTHMFPTVAAPPVDIAIEDNEQVPPRSELLTEAAALINGDRNKTYGSPTQNFSDTAAVWSVLLRHKLVEGARIEPGEVAQLMIALKLARMTAQPKRDNWADVAGYAGCGFEVDLETGRIKGDSI